MTRNSAPYSLSVGECPAVSAAVRAAETEAEAEELVLKPLGESFTKAVDDALLLTCEVTNAVDNKDYDIKWFGVDNREIRDRSGRSVPPTASLHPPPMGATALCDPPVGRVPSNFIDHGVSE